MISCLCRLVPRAAGKWPRNKAVIDASSGESVTYEALDGIIGGFSARLSRQGLKKGGRVGILARNSIWGIASLFAVSEAGGIAVPFNYELDTVDIARQAAHCGLSALCAGYGFEDKAAEIRDRAGGVRFIIPEAETPDYRARRKTAPCGQKDPALIIYTSGTTGRPLGATLSHKNLISDNAAIAAYTGITDHDKICCVLPLYYIYGLSLVLSHFLAGGAVILENRFMYPNTVLDAIERHKATGFAGVSAHYAILLYKSDMKKRKLSSLKYFLQAGDAMPPRLSAELARYFPDKRLYMMYGLTEAAPRLTYLDPAQAAKKPRSVGKAIRGVEVRVAGRSGRERGPNKTGEIIARGDNIMLGYWANRRRTAKTIRKSWLYTGDMGYKDKDGDLFIVGRKGGIIKDSKILKSIPKKSWARLTGGQKG